VANHFNLPEAGVPVLSEHSWNNGKAIFVWSDGTTTERICSQADALEKLAAIQRRNGRKF
jgi:hypothetical protein